MFFHNYRYRMKCIFRDRQLMFWTFLFPILLATLFNLALSDISSSHNFSNVNVAVIQNDELDQNPAFKNALENTDDLFNLQYVSVDEAENLLDDNKIDGYLLFDPDLQLIVKQSGINQTIIKSFIDDYQQTTSTLSTIATLNPAAFENGLHESVSNRTDMIKTVSVSRSNPDNIVIYFFALIAMTCLYGGFLGVKEVVAIQADQSPIGARVNLAPTNKLLVFIASILAATTIMIFELIILLTYLIAFLKIDFGNQLGYIALTCVLGSLTGVTFGACIAALVKKSEGIKIGILIGATMTMSFLSGMMVADMKYIISTRFPILAYLNPANLITDSLYALYYYDTHTQYFTDLILLCGFILAFSLITYFVLRRQKYASL